MYHACKTIRRITQLHKQCYNHTGSIHHELTFTAQEPWHWEIKQYCKRIRCQICRNNKKRKFPSTYRNMDSLVKIRPLTWNPVQEEFTHFLQIINPQHCRNEFVHNSEYSQKTGAGCTAKSSEPALAFLLELQRDGNCCFPCRH